MLLVISPSKTQNPDVAVRGDYSLPLFIEQAGQLVAQLKQFDQRQLAELMKMSSRLAAVNFQRFQEFELPFTPENSRQALFMFQGDQFNAMDVEGYSKQQLAHGQLHLRILSGLYGMLRPLDLMQPYRLEMAARITVGEAQNLYSFWRETITREINRELETDPYPLLINLASAEYFKVIDKKELQADVLTCSFKQEKEGRLQTIAIYAKRARGAMVDFVIRNGLTDPKDLQAFTVNGYRFKPELSTDNEWLFVQTFS